MAEGSEEVQQEVPEAAPAEPEPETPDAPEEPQGPGRGARIVAGLRRFKDDVTEVRSGLECGMTFDGFTDLKQNDIVEVFQLEERTRTL